MLELFIVAQIQAECFKSPKITERQHYKVEKYIVQALKTSQRRVDKSEIDSILGFSGCLIPLQGSSSNLQVWRWEANNGKVIEIRFEQGRFVSWKGEGF